MPVIDLGISEGGTFLWGRSDKGAIENTQELPFYKKSTNLNDNAKSQGLIRSDHRHPSC